MSGSTDYPVVRIVNDQLPALHSRIELDGQDISRWVCHYEVIGNLNDATILRLDLLVGGLEIEAPVSDELEVGPAAEALLLKHGWKRPSDSPPAPPVEPEPEPDDYVHWKRGEDFRKSMTELVRELTHLRCEVERGANAVSTAIGRKRLS